MSKYNDRVMLDGTTKATIRLRFPAEVRQIDSCSIEVTLPTVNAMMFTPEYIELVLQTMGQRDGELFLQTEATKVQRAQLIQSIV